MRGCKGARLEECAMIKPPREHRPAIVNGNTSNDNDIEYNVVEIIDEDYDEEETEQVPAS
jgi:hypothetical protein